MFGDTDISHACVARLCGKNMESIIEFVQLYSAQYTSLSRLRDQKIERVSELLGESFRFRKLVSITLNWRIYFSPPSESESQNCVTDGTVPLWLNPSRVETFYIRHLTCDILGL